MNDMENAGTEIYSVSFHTQNPKRTHTFWFTSLEKATAFSISLVSNRRVTDCVVYEIRANLCKEYVPGTDEGQVAEMERWKREPDGRWIVTRPGHEEQTEQ